MESGLRAGRAHHARAERVKYTNPARPPPRVTGGVEGARTAATPARRRRFRFGDMASPRAFCYAWVLELPEPLQNGPQ